MFLASTFAIVLFPDDENPSMAIVISRFVIAGIDYVISLAKLHRIIEFHTIPRALALSRS